LVGSPLQQRGLDVVNRLKTTSQALEATAVGR
jgi:hypothetical protein